MPRGSKPHLLGTIQRSPTKAQRSFKDTLESAHETYGGDEERAHRAAYSASKHSVEDRRMRVVGPSPPMRRFSTPTVQDRHFGQAGGLVVWNRGVSRRSTG